MVRRSATSPIDRRNGAHNASNSSGSMNGRNIRSVTVAFADDAISPLKVSIASARSSGRGAKPSTNVVSAALAAASTHGVDA